MKISYPTLAAVTPEGYDDSNKIHVPKVSINISKINEHHVCLWSYYIPTHKPITIVPTKGYDESN